MNREEYIACLSKYLHKLPKSDYEDAISHFEECFDDVGREGEAKLIEELGEPRKLASEILYNLLNDNDLDYIDDSSNNEVNKVEDKSKNEANKKHKNTEKRYGKTALIAILLIFAAPIGLPLTLAAIMVVFAIVVAIASIAFAGVVVCGSFVLVAGKIFITGISMLPISLAGALVLIGFSLIVLGLIILIFIAIIYLIKLAILGIKALSNKIFKKGGNR